MFLPESNHVVVMDEGAIIEQGHHTLLARQGGVLSEMLRHVKLNLSESRPAPEVDCRPRRVARARP
jgi:hypothetical protein